MNAKTAREQMYLNARNAHKLVIYRLKDQLDAAVKEAINKGLAQASITLSEDIDPELVQGLKNALVKLGYKVKVEIKTGIMDENVLIMPRTKLTLGW